MRLIDRLGNRIGIVSKATAQERLNKAREEAKAAEEPAKTSRSNLTAVYDADYRPGGIPYSVLRGYSNANEPARLCVNRVKSLMHTIEWEILPVDEDAADDQQIEAGKNWFSVNGGIGRPGTMIEEFLDELIEDLLVCGCVALYVRPTLAKAAGLPGGKVASIEPIDAATIIPKRDSKGWIPEPPAIAYEQRTSDGTVRKFTRDELIYRTWGPKTYSAYGQSFIECALMAIMQYQAADIYNLVWFTEGDSVIGYWTYEGAGEVTPQQQKDFDTWVRMKGLEAKQKGKPLGDLRPPAGWKYTSFRPRSEADYIATQRFLLQRIAPFFGLTPSFLGFESDTYKASQAAQMDLAIRGALVPIAKFFGSTFTSLLQGPLELPDVQFSFDVDLTDQERVARIVKLTGAQVMTPNEQREMLGLPKLKGGYADDLFVVGQASLMPIASADEGRQIEAILPTTEEAGTQAPETTAGVPGEQPGLPPAKVPNFAALGSGAAKADLRRWRDKVAKAEKQGKAAGAVQFLSDIIPAAQQAEIRKALAAGEPVKAVFEKHLAAEEAGSEWAEYLEKGLTGLNAALEKVTD